MLQNGPTLACAVLVLVLPGWIVPAAAAAADAPRVFVLDPNVLVDTRSRVAAGDQILAPAVARLRDQADEALNQGPFSVTDAGPVPPSGDPHDYTSVGPYWWPDPQKPDGLPYIRRDGRVNPEYYEHDTVPRERMCDAVETLALAYYLTGHTPYAERAALLLRTWFLDLKTRMNPNLQFGQAVPGHSTGRGVGLIDTASFIGLVDAVGMISGAEGWTADDQRSLETWFGEFLDWMLESRYGRDEAAASNNHGTWYDAQVASYALFARRSDLARRILSEAATKRIASQIEPDGRQPQELARTRSFSYSVMNLRGMFTLAALAERVQVDLWNLQTDDGRSIRKALDWLAPFASGEKPWSYEQIGPVTPESLYPLLRRAAIAYNEPAYEAQIAGIPRFDPAAERTQLLCPERHPKRETGA